MRSYLAKAIAVVLLTVLLGIPWAMQNASIREDAQTMSQHDWLAKMGFQQSSQAEGTGFFGTLVFAFLAFIAFVTIYEFTWRGVKAAMDRISQENGQATPGRLPD